MSASSIFTRQPARKKCAILTMGTKYPQCGRPVVAVPGIARSEKGFSCRMKTRPTPVDDQGPILLYYYIFDDVWLQDFLEIFIDQSDFFFRCQGFCHVSQAGTIRI